MHLQLLSPNKKKVVLLLSLDHSNRKKIKADKVLGLMKNTLNSWLDEIAKIINRLFVTPHLEFASKVWNPYLKYDSKRKESVQRRSTLTKESHHLP